MNLAQRRGWKCRMLPIEGRSKMWAVYIFLLVASVSFVKFFSECVIISGNVSDNDEFSVFISKREERGGIGGESWYFVASKGMNVFLYSGSVKFEFVVTVTYSAFVALGHFNISCNSKPFNVRPNLSTTCWPRFGGRLLLTWLSW